MLEVSPADCRHYIELNMIADRNEVSGSIPIPSQLPTKRPKVRCDSQGIAYKVSYER